MYLSFFKRIFDFVLSLFGFILLLPVFFIVTVILLIANGGNPFFVQIRPGKDERLFRVIKFKTMNDKIYPNGNSLPDAERMSSIGMFVRKTSLDEIPQLINVLKGDMSLVGPRPLLVEYLSLYNETQKRRHHVRPGITGWAQVNGRNTISWEEKFKLDVHYVNHVSLKLDSLILFNTVYKVFASHGITALGMATTEKFTGQE